ncbi:hypothetical protein TCSYLVIO_006799 [Trypanosoma cruzi]|uniref:Uncharacterized protein n=2 Tax=Trypanosoma cruzi TaxID=5693 RepID=V5BI27_TRYCR|nr:hypothetical protein TCSYLVIO_006799 [Trypanosoma cruzi]ESS65757.1 hypothetical protein TCDM_05728 [Trypanosoma cruzi Dm28c]PBJ76418.1 hypothetical protein BCY84_09012 [Trypanosoma cruzi cruzi]PWU84331.1 hypothetical protein C4B63_235g11 [Trypanosoma cruzi]
MGKETLEAGAVEWDVNSPPDSPFITDPAMAERLPIPAEYVRRMEEAQRLFALHDSEQQALAYAYRRATWMVGLQCGWLGIGGWLTVRGYRYADPVQSFVSGFTSNRIIRRLFTPLAMLGLTITTLTGVQLPFDVRAMLVAGNAWRLEEAQKTDALKERSMALHEGKAIFDRLKEEERQAFEVGMEETKNSPK